MADGDYERGRSREIGAIAAELKRLAAARSASVPYQRELPVFVLNGWASSTHAWDLCRFMRTRLFGYVEQLDGEPEKSMESVERCILVGWSMGGSSALRSCRTLAREDCRTCAGRGHAAHDGGQGDWLEGNVPASA